MSTVTDLFETIGQAIGRSARTTISLESNFYQLGGNSLNSIYTVAQLRNQGYFIGISDFITAKTLRDVLDKLLASEAAGGIPGSEQVEESTDGQMRLRSLPLQHKDKSEVIE